MHTLFLTTLLEQVTGADELGRFSHALPAALRHLGHDVRVVLPRYRNVNEARLRLARPIASSFLSVGEQQESLCIYSAQVAGIPVYLLDIPSAFERPNPGQASDDDRRFILFARGVLALMLHLQNVEDWPTEIVHANDWQTALVPNYVKTRYRHVFGNVGTIYTVHQLVQQGRFNPFTLHLSGLSEGGMVETHAGLRANDLNFAARGLLFADVLTANSPTQALDMLTSAGSAGLHSLLHSRHERLCGILPGIDSEANNPETDPALAAQYSASNLPGKHMCKMALQHQFNIGVDAEQPLFCAIGPLANRYNDLVAQLIPWLIGQTRAQIIVAGNGQPAAEHAMRALSEQYSDRVAYAPQVTPLIEQQVYAGSDACVLPYPTPASARAAMLALRYGCVPIARAAGALNDIVREGPQANGFCFDSESSYDCIKAVQRSLACFQQPADWAQLRARGMRDDFSWLASAREYIGLYDWARRIIGVR